MAEEKKLSQLDQRAQSVAEKTGWDINKAKKTLVRVKKEYGIRYYEYDNRDLYKVPEEQLPRIGEELALRRERQESRDEVRIKKIMKRMDLSQEEASALYAEAKAIKEISMPAFMKNELFLLPKEEWLSASKSIKSDVLEKYAESVAKKAGWDIEKAKERMMRAKEKYGIRFYEYENNDLFEIPEGQLTRISAELASRRELKEDRDEARIQKIMDQMNLSHGEAEAIMLEAKAMPGLSLNSFMRNELYLLPKDEWLSASKYIKSDALDRFAESVAEKTGWDVEKARDKLIEAKDKYNIRYIDYDSKNLFNYAEEQLADIGIELAEQKNARKMKEEERIQRILFKTDLNYEEAKELISEAKKVEGLPVQTFIKNDLFLLPKEEWLPAYERWKSERDAEEDRNINMMMEGLGISREEADAMIADALKERKISKKLFFKYQVWKQKPEEQVAALIKTMKRGSINGSMMDYLRYLFYTTTKRQQDYTSLVADFVERQQALSRQKGQPVDKSLLPANKMPSPVVAACYYLGHPLPATATTDYQPSHYIGPIKGDYESLCEMLGEEVMPKNAVTQEIYNRFRNKFMEMHSMEFNETDLAVYFTDYFIHCRPAGFKDLEYFDYDFFCSESEKRDSFVSSVAYAEYVRAVCNSDVLLFKNKAAFNDKFGEFIRRDWLDTTKCSFDEFKEYIKRNPEFFAKPVEGAGGEASGVIDSTSDTAENVFERCKQSGMIIEKVIRQHEVLSRVNESSLNTVRFYTVVDADDMVHIIACIVKFGREGVEVDNLHMGGMGVMVDPKTGVLYTEAITNYGDRFDKHPDSQIVFKGYQLPCWDNVRETVSRMAIACSGINRHVGWDTAILQDGSVEIVEGNGMPDFVFLQQIDKIGRRPDYDRCLTKLAKIKNLPTFDYHVPAIDASCMYDTPQAL